MLLKAFEMCIGFDLESSLLGTGPVEIIGQGSTCRPKRMWPSVLFLSDNLETWCPSTGGSLKMIM